MARRTKVMARRTKVNANDYHKHAHAHSHSHSQQARAAGTRIATHAHAHSYNGAMARWRDGAIVARYQARTRDRNKFWGEWLASHADNAMMWVRNVARHHIEDEIMDAKKRNAVITAAIDGQTLTLTFANGETLTLRADTLTSDVQQYAMMHGLKQKLVDAAAISRNPETGRPASPDDKFHAVKAVYDRLLAGQWNAAREGGGNAGGLLLQALCRMYAGRKTVDELKAFLADKTDAEKTALRKNPRVASVIEEIRAEQGKAANVDTDELLGELED